MEKIKCGGINVMKNKVAKKILPLAMLISVLAASVLGGAYTSSAKAELEEKQEIRNVIFLIGDGMGVPYMTAHRYMKNDPKTKEMELTEFDHYLVGQQTTYPDDELENITDSASAATAMSGGVKTYNNAIAVDHDKNKVKTVLEQAKENGKATGLVATSEITHATPAAFGAHNESRKNMDEIADDYYDELVNGKHKIDVMLGGGKKNFVRSDRNLAEAFQQDGFSYVTNRDELLNDKNNQILGLFAEGGLPKMLDRTNETPSLAEMTTTALERLSKNENGFFLMVEGSQIDWAGHDNDIVGAMSEMEDFEQAFKVAIDYAKNDPHTLVIATADHSTGGLSLGANDEDGNGIYNWDPSVIKAAKRTPAFMTEEIASGEDVEETLNMYIDLELTVEEIDSVQKAADEYHIASNKEDRQYYLTAINNAIKYIFDARSHTGWTTNGHTAEEVNVYAYGPGKELFAGLIDNTKSAEIIFAILEETKKN